MRNIATWARDLAEAHMSGTLGRRWQHVQAVAAKAESLGPAAGLEHELLVATAWLHDIGYAPELVRTGFHPIDGAWFLRSAGVDGRLCALVANHSGAAVEAELRGLSAKMAEFPDEPTLVRDALWCCDMTTGPSGEPMTFDERLAEIRVRYGEEHTVPRAIGASGDEIRAAIDRVSAAMTESQ